MSTGRAQAGAGRVAGHLLRAARSGPGRRSWFTGRAPEIAVVTGWVRRARPGVHVVLGGAGTGTSALLGRLLSLADPVERARLARDGGWAHADPGAGSVHAHVDARGLDHDGVARALVAGLKAACRLPPTTRADAIALVGGVARAGSVPVLVADGLDEAVAPAEVAAEVLVPLGRHATVVVGTRPDTAADLPAALAPGALLELGPAPERDVRDYVAARSGAAAPADLGDGSFLLARLVLDGLPPGAEPAFPPSVGGLLDAALRAAGPRAAVLLRVLAGVFGPGLREPDWCAAATAAAGVPALADALAALADAAAQAGCPERGAGAWADAVRDLPAWPDLLLARAQDALAGDPDAAGWLAAAFVGADGRDASLVAAVGVEVRRHGDADPRWAAVWPAALDAARRAGPGPVRDGVAAGQAGRTSSATG